MLRKYSIKMLGLEAITLLLALVFLAPFYYVLVNSVKSFTDILTHTSALPAKLHWENFTKAWSIMKYEKVFLNSLIVTLLSNISIVIFCSMTAYKLVRTKSVVSNVIFFIFVAAMIIPFQSIMIPLISFATDLHLINSRVGLAFMYLGFGAGISVFLYHGFVKSIPAEIEEAATIDGCSPLRLYWRIIFPLLKPITATVVILNSLWFWNDFLLPSIVLKNEAFRTIPLATYYFFGQFMKQWDLALAGLLLSIIPVVIFYVFMQRYIIQGIVSGSVK